MTAYRVLVGLDYAGKRAEPGDIVSDLPPKSVGWLTAQNIVEKVGDAPKAPAAPVETESPKMREQQSQEEG